MKVRRIPVADPEEPVTVACPWERYGFGALGGTLHSAIVQFQVKNDLRSLV
jgi:hypothetical protein